MSGRRITLTEIERAHDLIDPCFLDTPQFVSDPLSRLLDVRLIVKVETANPVRCFKGRGASYFFGRHPDLAHVVCASAGNFGQGMAWAARAAGADLTVFAATTASPVKVEAMRGFGAEVVLSGHDFDAAKDAARVYADAQALPFVEDSRDPEPTVGAGTIACELLAAAEPPDVIVVPVGNGALAAGVGTVATERGGKTQVIGVCAENAPAMERSWRSDTLVTTARADTIADGIAVRQPVPEALDDLHGRLADILLVSDAATQDWMRLAHRHLGLVLEPSAAIGLAAVAQDRARLAGRTVAVVLTGGNITDELRAGLTGG